MAETSELLDRLDVSVPGGIDSPLGQAAIATTGALVVGGLLAAIGLVIGLTRADILPLLAAGLTVVFAGAAFVLFRAMFATAEKHDGTPLAAVRHPVFFGVFGLLVVVVALVVGYLV